MTAPDWQSDRMLAWLAANPAWPNDPNAGPRFLEDEDTLRRSRGLSRSARREQRRPVPLRVDELGYEPNGRYHAEWDGVTA